MNVLFQIITGHAQLGGHLGKWQDRESECPKCKEKNETPYHYWNECPALIYDQWLRDHRANTKDRGLYTEYIDFFGRHQLLDTTT